MKSFKTPRKSLAGLDVDTTATLIAAAADVALVVDRKGRICDLAFGSDELAMALDGEWQGQPWLDTVTIESRPKVETLLKGNDTDKPVRWRQLNHETAGGVSVPVMYTAVKLGDDGRMLAIGRDLRPMASLQQRLIEAEQSLERDYSRLRHAETRYRLLFQVASEPVLIIDATTEKVVDANPAAAQLLGETVRRLVGRAFPEGFDAESTRALAELLATVRATGRGDEVRVRLASGERSFLAAASLFRQDNSSHFLLRLSPLRASC